MFREFNGFYYTAQVRNNDEQQKAAVYEESFATSLVQNPSDWVCSIERAELNLNSIPYWQFSKKWMRTSPFAIPPILVNSIDLISITVNSLNAQGGAVNGGLYLVHSPPPDFPIFSLSDLVQHINAELVVMPTPDLTLFLLDEQLRIRILHYSYFPRQEVTITFYGGLHLVLGCPQIISLGTQEAGSNYRRFNSYLCDLVSANLNVYMHDLRTNLHLRSLTQLGQAYGNQAPQAVPTPTATPHPNDPNSPMYWMFGFGGFPFARDPAVGHSQQTDPKDTIITSEDVEYLAKAGFPVTVTVNIDKGAKDVTTYPLSKMKILHAINGNWERYLDSYVHNVQSSMFEYVTPPRGDSGDQLQHIYFRVLGLSLNSERFDFGIQEVMSDIGGLAGNFGSTSKSNKLSMTPRQKVVFNPVQKRICQMNGIAPIRWIRIEALYRDIAGDFQIVNLNPGEIFDIKLSFFHR